MPRQPTGSYAFDALYDAVFPMVWSLSARHAVCVGDAEHLTRRILARVSLELDGIPSNLPFFEWLGSLTNQELQTFLRAPRENVQTLAR